MLNPKPTDVTFSLSLDGDELDVRSIAETLKDIEALLADIERYVRERTESSVRWRWGTESRLDVVASVNGASRYELERIVEEAQRGFEQAQRAAKEHTRVHWPESFGSRAQGSARRILQRLRNLQSITVRAENREPLVIEAAEVGETVVARKGLHPRRRIHSSIEGRLELISHRGKLGAAIRERRNAVQCTFPDEMLEKIKNLFDKIVVAEGLVSYRDDGTPISITDIKTLNEKKPGRDLLDFLGSAPDFTGGLSTEEFISKIREHGD